MTIADQARDNAIPCEMVLYAYRKSTNGIVVSFVVHPDDDIHRTLAIAPLGARFKGALVHVGDDELPIPRTAKEKHVSTAAQPRPDPKSAGAKRGSAQKSGILCNDPIFRAFLREEKGFDTDNADDAAVVVRQICQVESRSEFTSDPAAHARWVNLLDQYIVWKELEHA